MRIELQTYNERTLLRFNALQRDRNGFSGTIHVRSGGFSAERPIYFEQHNLASFCEQLLLLDTLTPGIARLRGDFEDDHLQFELFKNGRVYVTGELVEQGDPGQQLTYGFETDQTCLQPLLRDLTHLLNS